jgi:hypothetical protein
MNEIEKELNPHQGGFGSEVLPYFDCLVSLEMNCNIYVPFHERHSNHGEGGLQDCWMFPICRVIQSPIGLRRENA